jgi:hypothetical protein
VPVFDRMMLFLARGIGPVMLVDPDEGAFTIREARVDADGDGRSFLQDNCPSVANAAQTDGDNDGAGDACDLDLDEDGVLNSADNCPLLANPDQANRDGDRFGDACDADDDNDGMDDAYEAANGFDPLSAGDGAADADGDRFSNRIEALEGTNPRALNTKPAITANRKALLLGLTGAAQGPARFVNSANMLSTEGPFEAGALTLDTGNAELAGYVGTSRQDLRPAWCNVDDDPAEELVIGLGPGSRGWMEVKDDVSTGFAHLRWIKGGDRPTYHAANGETYPACGDVDGDGRDEIVVGYGTGGGGWLFVLEDALRNFAPSTQGDAGGPWIFRNLPALNAGNGSAYPTVGNFDADAPEEIAVGGGRGNEGRVFLYDDGLRQFRAVSVNGGTSMQVTGAGTYAANDGTVFPASCDLNADGRSELLFATGAGLHVRDMSTGQPAAFTPAINGWLSTPLTTNFVQQRVACANLAGSAEAEIVTVDAAGNGALHGGASLNLVRLTTLGLRDGARSWTSEWPALGGGYPLDSDNDGVFDAADAFPNDPAESRDLDRDGIGDNADTDDDGDGISDSFELATGLNPQDASGANGADGDLDGDGLKNLLEAQFGLSPNDAQDALSDRDGDGWNNWIEVQEGTLLNNAGSRPAVGAGRSALLVGTAGGGAGRLAIVDSARMLKSGAGPFEAGALTPGGNNAELTGYFGSAQQEMRPVWCNLDGDAAEELVIGHGRGSRGWMEIRDDAATGFAHLRWLKGGERPTYHAANGETFPACGDLDADGRDEIVVGYGAGAGGWLFVIDDAVANLAPLNRGEGNTPWVQRNWADYNGVNGAVYPTVGNFDADPAEEIAVGGGRGNEGWVRFYDDALNQFRNLNVGSGVWLQLGAAGNYATTDGTVWPVSCDLDADGRSELLLATGAGVQVMSTLTGQPVTYAPQANGWLETPLVANFAPQRVACGQLFGNAQAEILTLEADGSAALHAGPALRLKRIQTLQLRDGARSWLTEWPALGGGYPVDTDSDGVFDGADAFPNDPAESRDTDGDGTGDNADTDDDNDGMSDAFESANGLDPTLATGLHGANGDFDGDGLTNLYEMTHGFEPDYALDAALDADSDGFANWFEAQAGSDPRAGASRPTPSPTRRAPIIGRGPNGQGKADLVDSFRMLDANATHVAGTLSLDNSNADLAGYPLAQRSLRPVWCNVDNDPAQELVIGLGAGSRGWIEVKDDAASGFAHLAWIRSANRPVYFAANGETIPACGDLDGDGRDEIVVGYGNGGGGWLFLLDDATTNYAPLNRVDGNSPWLLRPAPTYNAANGATYPTVGNFDADPQAEVAVAGAAGSGGVVQIFDDALNSLRPLTVNGSATLQLGAPSYAATDGTVWPASCDLNADGRSELLLASGAGVQIFDMTTRRPLGQLADGWLDAPRVSGYVPHRVACGDLYGNAEHELLTIADGVSLLYGGAAQRLRRIQQVFTVDGSPAWSESFPAIGGGYPQDADGDGVFDAADAFPSNPAESADADGDGTGDNADTDDDNDGMSDAFEIARGLNPRLATGRDGATGDFDGDGLTNADEIARGTQVNDTDSDDDGIDDAYEIANGFNPLVADAGADSDGDGATDLQEYRGGGNPRDPASLPLLGRLSAMGFGAGGNGVVEIVGDNRRIQLTPNYAANAELAGYGNAQRESRPAFCDIDGDGRRELVIGMGPGGRNWLEIRDDVTTGFAHLRWLRAGNWQAYIAANGETFPACGDIDGDTRDELVVGYGRGGDGWLYLLDDAGAAHTPVKTPDGNGWLHRPFATYNAQNGAVYPAVGNLDGDGLAEIAAGGGSGNGGRVYVFDDALNGFRPLGTNGFAQSNWASYNTANGTTWPAICAYDRQGRHSLVVGLGSGGAGYLQKLDPRNGFVPFAAGGSGNWLLIADAGYASRQGEVRPVCAQGGYPDGLSLGFGFGAGGGGKFEFTDGSPAVTASNAAYSAANGQVWPAVDTAFVAPEPAICSCNTLSVPTAQGFKP